jgi:hypothetical protein
MARDRSVSIIATMEKPTDTPGRRWVLVPVHRTAEYGASPAVKRFLLMPVPRGNLTGAPRPRRLT